MGLLACGLAALAPFPAHAQPPNNGSTVQLAWDACYVDGGTDLKVFACNTNSGSETFVISATLGTDLPQFTDFQAELYLEVSGEAVMPSWWQIGTGLCRPSFVWSFSALPPAGSSGCFNPYGPNGAGGLSYSAQFDGDAPYRARILTSAALPGSIALSAGQNVFLAGITFSHRMTVGLGSCSGCASGVGIGLGRTVLSQVSPAPSLPIFYPEPGTNSDFISWQAPLSFERWYYESPFTGWYKYFRLVSPTPARRPTWGAIKQLYR